jgi:hypothetical protein
MTESLECIVDATRDGVWVNSALGCVGRFGRMGIDIHRTFEAQLAGEGECLFCTHGPVGLVEWHEFQRLMHYFYGVVIDDSVRPPYVK